jgi:DNA-nicking Smr family endonuclease
VDKQDDFDLFLAEIGDVKPLKQGDVVRTQSNANDALAKSLKRDALLKETQADKYHLALECREWIDPYDPISYRQDGIQDGVFKNLRMGKYAIEKKFNLSQLRIEEARTHLIEQIEKSFKQGVRVLLIQHGMGLKTTPKPGKLKSFLNMWLLNLPQVIAFHTAHQSHGGLSACYVLLKKNPEQKLINRERHQKRY